jgi:spermidine/putrescine transport system substrate-binding protein
MDDRLGMTAEELDFLHKASMTRAQLLRGAGASLLGVSMAGTLLAACGGDDDKETGGGGKAATGVDPAKAKGTLALLCWQGYDDKNAAKPLTDKGVKLRAQYVANNDEFITKLRGGGLGKYDIVTPYHGYIRALVAADLIQPLDYSKLPSTKTYLPQFQKPEFNTIEGKTYSAPMVWGDTPMVYRPDLIDEVPKAWADLVKPEYKGKVVLWDDGYGHILLFSKVLFGGDKPNEITKDQLAEVIAKLREVKKNAVTVAPSHGDVADILARGDGAIATESWAFVRKLIRDKGKPAEMLIPEEGAFSWADSYSIAKDAPNLNAAYAFIDTMVSAQGDSVLGEATSSGVTNQASIELLPKEQRKLYPYDDLESYLAKLGFYDIPPLEPEGDTATLKEWNAAWEEFKAA